LKHQGKGTVSGLGLIATVVAVAGLAFAGLASANNLDRQTMTNTAKEIAKKDCRKTSGCEDYFVRKLHRVSRHKGFGEIHVISHKNRRRFDCVRKIGIKLDHETGRIYSAKGDRDCTDIGPQ
jgi:hypothetical protein